MDGMLKRFKILFIFNSKITNLFGLTLCKFAKIKG